MSAGANAKTHSYFFFLAAVFFFGALFLAAFADFLAIYVVWFLFVLTERTEGSSARLQLVRLN